jgi:tetratricopeptide (TPR) repeat protein
MGRSFKIQNQIRHLGILMVLMVLMVLMEMSHAAGWLPDDKQIQDFNAAKNLTRPVEVRKVAEQLPSDSPLRYLLLGRSSSIEGSHARAIRFFELAIKMMGNAKNHQDINASARWRAYGLYWLARCLLDAGMDEEQLEILERYRSSGYAAYEQLNEIKVPAAYFEVLALLKKGDVELAVKILSQSREGGGKTPSLNSMHAALLDMEVKEAQGVDVADLLKVSNVEVDARRASGKKLDSGLLSNLAYYSLRNGDFAIARKAFEECALNVNSQATYHPYRSLAEMELSAGNMEGASRMIDHCWKWQKTKRAGIRNELEKETLLTVANFYLALGYPEDAWRLVQPLLENGVRGGFRSSRPEKWQAGLCVTAVSALRVKSNNFWESAKDKAQRELIESRLRASIFSHLSNNHKRMSFEDLIDCPDWLWGEFLRCLGPALAERIIAYYPPSGNLAPSKKAAISLEIAKLRGNHSGVLDFAQVALKSLPVDCDMLRLRIIAAQADALWSLGRHQESLIGFENVLIKYPSLIPISDVRLPIYSDKKVTCHFMRSDISGFRLRLNEDASQWTWTLESPQQKLIRRVTTKSAVTSNWPLSKSIFCIEKTMTAEKMNQMEGK